jgi:hypothetical protein
MMVREFFALDPEVAGGLGPHTLMDASVHPPVVSKLHYQFDGWLGDEIVESFPCFLVTEALFRKLAAKQLTGIESAEVEVSCSQVFEDACRDVHLPPFVWLKVAGVAGRDDFGIGPTFRLVVSSLALEVIQSTRPRGLDVEAL